MSKPSLYDTLGVSASATPEQIRAAYRQRASAFHPDKATTDAAREEATDRMKAVNEANDVLSDPERRKAYDESGSTEKPVDVAPAAADMLEKVLKFAMDNAPGDYVTTSRECLQENLRENQAARAKGEKRIAALEKRRARIKVTREGVTNVAHQLIDREIDSHRKGIKSTRLEDRIIHAVLGLLADYEYVPEEEFKPTRLQQALLGGGPADHKLKHDRSKHDGGAPIWWPTSF